MAPAPVRYTFAWDDYVGLDLALRRESFMKRNQLVIVPLFLTLCVIGFAFGISAVSGQPAGRFFTEIASNIYIWLLPIALVPVILIANRIERRIWYKRQRVDGLEIEARFDDPKGLRLESVNGGGVNAWSAIRKVVTVGATHVVLLENRMVGVCLPRRAFASDADFDAAKAHIERKISEARSAAA
jgi:hypothetical protein